MSMKVCKDCGTEVSKRAQACPKCGRKLKKSSLRIVLGIIVLIIGISIMAGSGNNTTSTNNSSNQSVVTKENYDKINKGMTEQQVKDILGEPTSVSESETPGVGTMKLNHYQEGLELKGIDIYYLDGKVYMKNWTEL